MENQLIQCLAETDTMVGIIHMCEANECSMHLPCPKYSFYPVHSYSKIPINISCLPGITGKWDLSPDIWFLNRISGRMALIAQKQTLNLFFRSSKYSQNRQMICALVTFCVRNLIFTPFFALKAMLIMFWNLGCSNAWSGYGENIIYGKYS